MNAMHVRHQICLAVIVTTLVVFELIVPIKSIKTSSENTHDLELQKSFETIKSSIDSKASANGQFGSFFSAKQAKLPNPEFARLQEDIDTHMTNVDFNFDPADFEQIDLPQEQSIQPKKLLTFEPLRPFNYFPAQTSNYNPNFNDELPEHQDDGGDGDDGGGDGGDGGGGDGGDGGGGGGNGGGGGGGSGGGGSRRDDEDEQSFVQQQSIELDYDSLEPQNANGWRPIHPNYGSLRPRFEQPRKKLAPKKISGYGAHQIPVTEGNSYYQNPQSQRLTFKQRQPQSFDNIPYSPYDVEERRPLRVYKEDTQPLRQKEPA
ncbi:uncharacterized protein LOC126839323 [Adelges cooleyi]|uniref:uncharacterized protein LOC126839323 n=1 Tax=Adelges cooleyi TaxID=133065 RepID=UPI002180054C|nr:uncharacterized protein LOC126839323 [Adelges cooleyi]